MMTADGKNYPIFTAKTVSFVLDEDQVKKANEWAVTHECSASGSYGSAGDKFTFHFSPSGLGNFIQIECSCGKQADITGFL